jgi:hypothetical protein
VTVVVGAVADELGFAKRLEAVAVRHAGGNFDAQWKFWACPAAKFNAVQSCEIPVVVTHDGPRVGTIAYLEQTLRERLWAVAEVDVPADLFRRGLVVQL